MIKKDDVRMSAKQGAAAIIYELLHDIEEAQNFDAYFDTKESGKNLVSEKELANIKKFFDKYKDRIYKMIGVGKEKKVAEVKPEIEDDKEVVEQ